ncbi:MAG: ATP-grasp domain-containing protein [Gemmatimonadales bacterium]
MKIFVCEYVTGGGMAAEPLPARLAHEADLMVRALLADLSLVPGIELLTSRDARLPAVPGIEMIQLRPGESFLSLYRRGLERADAAWPTAPECGGALLQLARATCETGRVLLGCRPDAVEIATSKRATVAWLERAGIPAVRTASSLPEITERPGRWVIKPDDGAGCEETIVVESWEAARAALSARPEGHFIAQPWLDGEALSLSMICCKGVAQLLSVNRQHMVLDGGQLRLVRLEVAAMPDRNRQFQALADGIATAIPSLWGYVGVDLIHTATGPVVLEINPRLTTSYCGLRQALGINVARLVLELHDGGHPAELTIRRRSVAVALEMEAPGDR